jgi:hypothetical protein
MNSLPEEPALLELFFVLFSDRLSDAPILCFGAPATRQLNTLSKLLGITVPFQHLGLSILRPTFQ